MLTMAWGAPQDLSLIAVELQPVQLHPHRHGHFPAAFKEAFITPTVKKAGLDPTDVSSYRPISNLRVLSKLLERLVVRQLI